MARNGTLAQSLGFGLRPGTAGRNPVEALKAAWAPGRAGDSEFDAMRTAAPSALMSAAILALALVGAGSKAGLVPLHDWLPLAHPAAPRPHSALANRGPAH